MNGKRELRIPIREPSLPYRSHSKNTLICTTRRSSTSLHTCARNELDAKRGGMPRQKSPTPNELTTYPPGLGCCRSATRSLRQDHPEMQAGGWAVWMGIALSFLSSTFNAIGFVRQERLCLVRFDDPRWLQFRVAKEGS